MKRFFILCSILLACCAGRAQQRPNIVIIMADDMGYGDLSCYGAQKISTPSVDSIAAQGQRFTDAHTASSLCTPSRYSMMTGRYSWRTRLRAGVSTWFAKPLIEPGRTTLASLLKKNGYETACIGKWHLGFDWALKPGAPANADSIVFDSWEVNTQDYIDFSKPVKGGPVERGFDYYYGISASNNMIPFVYIENDRVTQPPTIKKEYVYDTDQESTRAANWDLTRMDEILAGKAVEVIDGHFSKHDKTPLFLYFATSAIHRPCLPERTKGKSGAGLRGDMVMEFDWVVRDVVNALRRNNALDNTLLIITSDNGGVPGDALLPLERYKKDLGDQYYPAQAANYSPQYVNPKGNAIGKKGWITYDHRASGPYLGFKSDAWEGGHRVPLIMRWPGVVKAGTVNNNMVCNADMLATFAELVGDHLAAGEGEDSYSYLSNITGKSSAQARRSLTMVAGGSGAFVVRQGNWKYIEPGKPAWGQTFYADGPKTMDYQLYDLGKDPQEQHNLYSIQPDRVSAFKKIIEQAEKQSHTEANR
jgi:arylsulfatase A-like enzyme